MGMNGTYYIDTLWDYGKLDIVSVGNESLNLGIPKTDENYKIKISKNSMDF
jgi:hypothetical protein